MRSETETCVALSRQGRALDRRVLRTRAFAFRASFSRGRTIAQSRSSTWCARALMHTSVRACTFANAMAARRDGDIGHTIPISAVWQSEMGYIETLFGHQGPILALDSAMPLPAFFLTFPPAA
jgi:hypothetical protein